MQWCVHDNQHVLNWAVLSRADAIDFDQELAWLARILEHRDFPLDRLARSLELLSQAVRALSRRGGSCRPDRGGCGVRRPPPDLHRLTDRANNDWSSWAGFESGRREIATGRLCEDHQRTRSAVASI
jgi:hypothetical protein